MEPHLYLRRGKKEILLVRYFNMLHFVNLDHRLNYKVRPWFLEKPRTEAEMDERGLVRTSISLKEIRGVAAGGTGRGMVVQFYLKEGKRRYELKEDCDLADMSALFEGLESFEPPKKDSNWSDPRLAKQDPKLRSILWPIGTVLNIFSVVSAFFIWAVGFEIPWICWISMICVPASIALYCSFSDYYTIFYEQRKYGQKKGALGLWGPLVCPAGMILGAVENYAWFNWRNAWLLGAVAVMILAGMLYLTAPVFRAGDKLAMFAIVGMLLSGGPVLALNNLMDSSPIRDVYTEVVDRERHTSSKMGDWYELAVILDGAKIDIPVDGSVFDETEVGEWVNVKAYEGAFAFPYVRIE